MKALCIIFVFCSVSFCFFVDSYKTAEEAYHHAMAKCINSTGVDDEIVYDLFVNVDAETDDAEVKCFFKCFIEEIGWMDGNGNLVEGPDYRVTLELLKIAKDCKDSVTDPDPCEKAYKFSKCVTKNNN